MTLPKLDMVQREIERRRKLKAVQDARNGGSILDAVVEPVKTIATGLAAEVGGGLSGMVTEAFGGDGVEMVESFRDQVSMPETVRGKKSLEKLGDLAQFGIDVVNFPISGIGGLIELVTGQGADQAANTVKSVQEDGAGVTAGRRVFEETGSPLLATGAQLLPEATAEVLGLKGASRPLRSLPGESVATDVATIAEPAVELFTRQSPAKRRIAQMLENGEFNVETAGFQLQLPAPERGGLPAVIDQPSGSTARVVPNNFELEAIRQGFDRGVIAALKGASDSDRAKMLEMVDITEQGKRNARFAATNRASDVVGRSVVERFMHVLNKNTEAGNQLDTVARELRGQPFNAEPAVNKFMEDLANIGVEIGDDLKPVFEGSAIEGLNAPQDIINRIVGRMAGSGRVDAFDAHQLKRFIDENVSFGKSGEGLTGRTEHIIKTLRRNLDQELDANFDRYNEVNTQYAETISIIDEFQSVAGQKMNLTGDNADKAIGTLSRRLLSNAQSRVTLLDSLNSMEEVATKYGGSFDDDLIMQVLFVDELDSAFGPVARTSLQGELAKQIPTNRNDLVSKAIEAGFEKVQGIDEEAALRAIRDLLNQ